MNRKEAFAYLMDTPNGKVQPDTWKTTSWYLELGGVASAQGGTPDQVMFVSNPTTKQASTHWPDVVYTIYEVAVAVTGSQVGKSVTEEAAKLGVAPTVAASLASSVKSSLGL